jgi:hypothetical protein
MITRKKWINNLQKVEKLGKSLKKLARINVFTSGILFQAGMNYFKLSNSIQENFYQASSIDIQETKKIVCDGQYKSPMRRNKSYENPFGMC